jgi:hypothetical protein
MQRLKLQEVNLLRIIRRSIGDKGDNIKKKELFWDCIKLFCILLVYIY